MVLNITSVGNSIEISLPLRLRPQSHDPARTISKASSAKTPSLLNPPPSDADGQECRQLVTISDIIQYCETSAPRGEKSRASYGNANSQNKSQERGAGCGNANLQNKSQERRASYGNANSQNKSRERILSSFPGNRVQSSAPEPVLASKNGPPVAGTTEDELEFLYSIPTRMNRMKNSGKGNKILEKGVGNNCFAYGNFTPEVAKEKIPDVESEKNSTLASTHFRSHIPPTRAETELLPTAAISLNRKLQQKKTSFKMEANRVQDDAPTTLKSKECLASLQLTASSLTMDGNAFEQGSQSVSPKTTTQQGLPTLQEGAQIVAESPIPVISQQDHTLLSPQQAQYYQHVDARPLRFSDQRPTSQQQAALRQYMIVENGNLQGFGLLPPQGPQASQFMPPMSHTGYPRRMYPTGSNLGYADPPSHNPQNGRDLASIPMGSYTTDDNIQRRPTLYGASEWQPSSGVAYGPSLSAQSIWQQGVRQFHTFGPVEGTAVSQATPPQSITPTFKPTYSQPIQQPEFQIPTDPDSTLAAQTMASAPAAKPAKPAKPSKSKIHLVVDIALTCEEHFPWERMAKKHGVDEKRVKDVFSTIIQIPLLKNASDARRYGTLASERLKEYKTMSKEAAGWHQEEDEPDGDVPKPEKAKRGRKREVDELGGDVPKPEKAKRVRKRKVVEPVEMQDEGEAPVQKHQTIEEKTSDEAAEWVDKLFVESDAVMGDGVENGDTAANN